MFPSPHTPGLRHSPRGKATRPTPPPGCSADVAKAGEATLRDKKIIKMASDTQPLETNRKCSETQTLSWPQVLGGVKIAVKKQVSGLSRVSSEPVSGPLLRKASLTVKRGSATDRGPFRLTPAPLLLFPPPPSPAAPVQVAGR